MMMQKTFLGALLATAIGFSASAKEINFEKYHEAIDKIDASIVVPHIPSRKPKTLQEFQNHLKDLLKQGTQAIHDRDEDQLQNVLTQLREFMIQTPDSHPTNGSEMKDLDLIARRLLTELNYAALYW